MNKNETKRRAIIFGGLIVIVVIAITFLVLTFFNKDKVQLPSNVSGAKSDNIQSGVAGDKASEKYNQMIEKHDNTQADKAQKSGESYFSIPTNSPPPPVEDTAPPPPKEEEPPVQSSVVRIDSVEQPKTAQARRAFTQDELKRMAEAITMLDGQLNAQITQGAISFLTLPQSLENVEQNISDPAELIPSGNGFAKGEILYAIVETAINSDVSSPVMASVISGQHRKTKFIGSFARFDKRLVVKFDRAILPDGSEVEVEAFAVDPNTTEASVASKVNTHFFSRWGGLVAASFLEGFGEATKFSGAESVDNVYGESTGGMVFNDYTVSDQLWIAAGKVGERASEVFAQNFNRPPTVYLNTGAEMGILILNTGG